MSCANCDPMICRNGGRDSNGMHLWDGRIPDSKLTPCLRCDNWWDGNRWHFASERRATPEKGTP